MKTLILNKEQLERLIDISIEKLKSWEYYNNFQKYKKEYPEYTYEFDRFPTYYTGLPVDILIDDNASYLHCKHPLWVYVSNGYIDGEEQLLPIAVHRYKPIVLDKNANIQFDEETLNEVIDFIKKFYYPIVEYSNGRITCDEMEDCILSGCYLFEGILSEIPTFTKSEVNLPTDIWIDGQRDLQHQLRIKFKDRKDGNTKTWASMTIDKLNPEVKNLYYKTFLTKNDIENIKDFVKTNYETLKQSAEGLFNNKSEILDALYIDRNISDLLNLSDKVNVEIASIKDFLYFIVENNEDSIKYIQYLSTVKPFKIYNDYSAYINIEELKGNSFQKKQLIISILKNVAKKLNIKLNIVNLKQLDVLDKIK